MINRDRGDIHDDMERGQVVTPGGTIHEKELIVTEKPVADEDESSGSTPVTSTSIRDGGEAESTPGEHGGSVTLSEWREGPHLVVERRNTSAGEVCAHISRSVSGVLIGCFPAQVEVEVVRNVDARDGTERLTSRFVGEHSEVRNAVSDYLRWLKEDAHKRAEGIMGSLKSAEEDIKRRLSPKMHSLTLDSQPAVKEVHSPAGSVGESGWASDKSDTRESRPTKTKSLHIISPPKHTRHSKYNRPSTAETPNISREHSRSRADRSSTPSPQPYGRRGTGIPVSRTNSWDLGSLYNPRPSSAGYPDSRRGSVRNLRIESLRTAGMPGSPRELSPARSVRFVDSHPPRLQDTLQSGHGDNEQDSPRATKVAFELPNGKQ